MKPLILTNNPNLASTARVLQHWLRRDNAGRLDACVALPREGDFSAWLRAEGVPVHVTPMPRPSKRWPAPGLWHAWRLANWAKRCGVDVIHCNEHDVYPFAFMLRKMLRLPLVCHVRFSISRQFATWAFGPTDRRPDALLWTTRAQQQDCADAVRGIVPEEKQHVVPLGVDVARLTNNRGMGHSNARVPWVSESASLPVWATQDRTGKERARNNVAPGATRGLPITPNNLRRTWRFADDAIILGAACALRPIKQLEHFVELTQTLAREDDRVVGVIAGDAPPGLETYRDELLDCIAAAQLGPRLKWLGHVDDIHAFMSTIDVFVSTSKYETFGNSVCEAMAEGVAVAGYEGGSVGEVAGDAGLIVETSDLAALTLATRQLVRSADLRADLGRRARQRVIDRYDPAASLGQLRGIYASILEPERATRWAA